MRTRALAIAALCAAVMTNMALADPPAGGPNGKGPDGQGPLGHAGDPSAQRAPLDTPLSPEGQVTVGADQNIARNAVDAGRALPLAEISARIAATLGARIIDARLITTHGALVYRLVILSDQGVSRRLYVDARTGNEVPAR